jgi:hypothetical protein
VNDLTRTSKRAQISAGEAVAPELALAVPSLEDPVSAPDSKQRKRPNRKHGRDDEGTDAAAPAAADDVCLSAAADDGNQILFTTRRIRRWKFSPGIFFTGEVKRHRQRFLLCGKISLKAWNVSPWKMWLSYPLLLWPTKVGGTETSGGKNHCPEPKNEVKTIEERWIQPASSKILTSRALNAAQLLIGQRVVLSFWVVVGVDNRSWR